MISVAVHEGINQGAHDKVLLNAILLAGLGLKCTLTGTAEAAREELVELHVMANRTAASLFSVLLGSLNANRLQTCVQSIMLLAWHDLTRKATPGTSTPSPILFRKRRSQTD